MLDALESDAAAVFVALALLAAFLRAVQTLASANRTGHWNAKRVVRKTQSAPAAASSPTRPLSPSPRAARRIVRRTSSAPPNLGSVLERMRLRTPNMSRDLHGLDLMLRLPRSVKWRQPLHAVYHVVAQAPPSAGAPLATKRKPRAWGWALDMVLRKREAAPLSD